MSDAPSDTDGTRVHVDEALVKKVAHLAHLQLTPDEVVYYESHLRRILGYVERLNDHLGPWDAKGVATRSQGDLACPERDDIATASLDPATFLDQAPETAGTSFKVPRVID